MKKAAVILAAVMIATPALAELKPESAVFGHNLYSEVTGAAELTGIPTTKKASTGSIQYYTVNGVDVGFITDESGSVTTVYCRAKEESAGEFLSQCASALYNIAGENVSYWYPRLLEQFISARSGNPTEEKPFIPGVCMFDIKKKGEIYQFLAAILE